MQFRLFKALQMFAFAKWLSTKLSTKKSENVAQWQYNLRKSDSTDEEEKIVTLVTIVSLHNSFKDVHELVAALP